MTTAPRLADQLPLPVFLRINPHQLLIIQLNDDAAIGQHRLEEWFAQYEKKVDAMLETYRELLIRKGFSREDIATRSTVRYCPSMAQCILSERDQIEYSTIVVGRQGLSRSEEFLFGSISSKIVNHARNCTVWVVE